MVQQEKHLHPALPLLRLFTVQRRVRLGLVQARAPAVRGEHHEERQKQVAGVRLFRVGDRAGAVGEVEERQHQPELRPRAQRPAARQQRVLVAQRDAHGRELREPPRVEQRPEALRDRRPGLPDGLVRGGGCRRARAGLFVAPRDVEERRVAQTFRHSGRGQRQVTQVVLAFPRAVPAVQARVRGLRHRAQSAHHREDQEAPHLRRAVHDVHGIPGRHRLHDDVRHRVASMRVTRTRAPRAGRTATEDADALSARDSAVRKPVAHDHFRLLSTHSHMTARLAGADEHVLQRFKPRLTFPPLRRAR